MPATFVIYASSFDENSGGSIALHRLCDVLNRMGHRARLWPWHKPLTDLRRPLHSLRAWNRHLRMNRKQPYRTLARFETPLATTADLEDAIVVYPEVIDGNPLRARRVVRWLLHKPGFHTGRHQFGPDELFFYFQAAFNDPLLNPHDDRLLQTFFVRDDVYRDERRPDRQGTCYILRKGRDRPLVHDAANSILVDGLDHAATAAIFNRVQTCISYDLYTMYSMYAAMCGCDSIVVPEAGLERSAWYPSEEERYGMAYGWDDLAWARATRDRVLPRFKALEERSNQTVQDFVRTCAARFG